MYWQLSTFQVSNMIWRKSVLEKSLWLKVNWDREVLIPQYRIFCDEQEVKQQIKLNYAPTIRLVSHLPLLKLFVTPSRIQHRSSLPAVVLIIDDLVFQHIADSNYKSSLIIHKVSHWIYHLGIFWRERCQQSNQSLIYIWLFD